MTDHKDDGVGVHCRSKLEGESHYLGFDRVESEMFVKHPGEGC